MDINVKYEVRVSVSVYLIKWYAFSKAQNPDGSLLVHRNKLQAAISP